MSGYKSSLLAMVEQMDEEKDIDKLRVLYTFATRYSGDIQKQREVGVFINAYAD